MLPLLAGRAVAGATARNIGGRAAAGAAARGAVGGAVVGGVAGAGAGSIIGATAGAAASLLGGGNNNNNQADDDNNDNVQQNAVNIPNRAGPSVSTSIDRPESATSQVLSGGTNVSDVGVKLNSGQNVLLAYVISIDKNIRTLVESIGNLTPPRAMIQNGRDVRNQRQNINLLGLAAAGLLGLSTIGDRSDSNTSVIDADNFIDNKSSVPNHQQALEIGKIQRNNIEESERLAREQRVSPSEIPDKAAEIRGQNARRELNFEPRTENRTREIRREEVERVERIAGVITNAVGITPGKMQNDTVNQLRNDISALKVEIENPTQSAGFDDLLDSAIEKLNVLKGYITHTGPEYSDEENNRRRRLIENIENAIRRNDRRIEENQPDSPSSRIDTPSNQGSRIEESVAEINPIISNGPTQPPMIINNNNIIQGQQTGNVPVDNSGGTPIPAPGMVTAPNISTAPIPPSSPAFAR